MVAGNEILRLRCARNDMWEERGGRPAGRAYGGVRGKEGEEWKGLEGPALYAAGGLFEAVGNL